MTDGKWKKIGTEVVFDAGIFRLRRDTVINPRNQLPLKTYGLESPDWVNIIALTPENEVVLVSQFRHGIEAVSLEIPGGVIDPGEEPIEAAARELLEETGFSTARIIPIGVVDAQPAYQNNRCHTFLALDVKRTAEPTPDEGEDLEVSVEPLARVRDYLRQGRIAHGLIVAAFHWLEFWLADQRNLSGESSRSQGSQGSQSSDGGDGCGS
jgi:8-oxo-dGTP pyrophosphatase MutT (NUDIX family)